MSCRHCGSAKEYKEGYGDYCPKCDISPDDLPEANGCAVLSAVNEETPVTRAWISVKDKLPGYNQDVLFVAKANSRLTHMNGKVYVGRYDGLDFAGVPLFSMPGFGIEGTHWMPLPELPKQ